MPKTQIWVPPTTDITIVFPKTGSRFYSEYYSPDLTDHRLSREDIAQFMQKIDNIRLNPEDSRRENRCTLYLLIAWLLEYVTKKLLCYLGILDEDQGQTYMWIAVIFSCMISCCFFGHIEENQKDAIRKMVGEENQILKNKGLRWNLPNEFPAWIELCKDYKNQNYINQPANQELRPSSSDQDLEKQIQSQTTKISSQDNFVPLSEDQDEN